MEHWWNYIDTGHPTYSVKTPAAIHSVHHKSHVDKPGIEPEPPR